MQRLALGLYCPPPSLESIGDDNALYEVRGGWLQLRPRWPLTEERHPRAVHRCLHYASDMHGHCDAEARVAVLRHAIACMFTCMEQEGLAAQLDAHFRAAIRRATRLHPARFATAK